PVSTIILDMTIKALRLTIHENIPLNLSASTLDGLTSQLSDGFYTTFSTLSGGTRVLGLQAHLHRLYVPAAEMSLRPSIDEKTLRQRMGELTRENLPQETRIRLILAKDTGDVY